jgi:ABC-type iron transport system FetAB permease component
LYNVTELKKRPKKAFFWLIGVSSIKGRLALLTKTSLTTTMTLFFIGVLEMLIVSTWTKAVTETKVVVSGIVTILNVLVWYYVLQRVVSDLGNWQLVAMYAVGCACGTVLSTLSFRLLNIKKRSKTKDKEACPAIAKQQN